MVYGKDIDNKWIKKWEENKTYEFKSDNKGEKLYVLEMFSYPSSNTLHIGHWFNYAPVDSFARYKKMKGYNVFHPMGFDSFGLPAENYAIKTNTHPKVSTRKNIDITKRQLKDLGGNYDWDYYVETSDENYYKWTQWLFLQLYKNNLAYKKNAYANWCPSCNTTLANEQVIQGKCDRCGSEVSKKKISQWFFKITDYAERLDNDLKKIDWPSSTKKIQSNWIGKSTGSEIIFKIKNFNENIKVFTTRADTLFGVTYVVLSPESDLLEKIVSKSQKKHVNDYQKKAASLSEIERMETNREKTGVFTGAYAINPINNEEVPIWVGDYVLEDYGTGCVMAVPAHDTRDFEFAKKFNLPIKQVIKSIDIDNVKLPFIEEGILINSNKFTSLETNKAKSEITKKLEKEKNGNFTTNFRIRDWLVSRQRYWGAPIPIVYCEECGIVAEKEENLPIKLPDNVKFSSDGTSPLAKDENFLNCKCPKCGKDAKRESDTLDTFVCSSWYYLRYPDPDNSKEPFNSNKINKFLPVDMYVGGKEHAAMHLLYARFINKFLFDQGYINFDEPFSKLRHQGMIVDSNGEKMSKSKGNTINPDEYINEFGADVLRNYLMFGFSYEDGGPWNENGFKSIRKHILKIEDFFSDIKNIKDSNTNRDDKKDKEFIIDFTKLVKNIEDDYERLHFNTVISKNMELLSLLNEYKKDCNSETLKKYAHKFLLIIAPNTPFLSEEIFSSFGNKKSIHHMSWPSLNEKLLKEAKLEIAIQINGKLRATMSINQNDSKEEIIKEALKIDNVIKHIDGKKIKKEIYVKNKILNLVV